MTFPLANRSDLRDVDFYDALHEYEPRHWDEDGYEQTERRNGATQCPECELWWPNIEEPDCWVEGDDGRWNASGWWGATFCEMCELLMVTQPDGTGEVYDLKREPQP